jgi:hypothetical protein
MTKNEKREADKLMFVAGRQITDSQVVGYVARGMSALIRASSRSRNELITIASSIPAIVQHPDFIL